MPATTPTQAEVASAVRELLAEILEAAPEEVSADSDLRDELGADSLQQLELMSAVEERFDIQLDAEDWSDARTISELAERTRVRILSVRDDGR